MCNNSCIKDYDYIEMEIVLDTTSCDFASGNVTVQIHTGVGMSSNSSGWTGVYTQGTAVTLSDRNTKKIKNYMKDTDDSLSINVQSAVKDAVGTDIDKSKVKVGFANAYLVKKRTEAEFIAVPMQANLYHQIMATKGLLLQIAYRLM